MRASARIALNDPLQIAGTIPWSDVPVPAGGGRGAVAAEEFNETLARSRREDDAVRKNGDERRISVPLLVQ